jgi:uncharacterized RDD family membrane protein YckC
VEENDHHPPDGQQPAGFSLRCAAFVIDVTLVVVPVGALVLSRQFAWVVSPLAALLLAGQPEWVWWLAYLLLAAAYCTVPIGQCGQTLGMAVAGIRATGEDGRRVGFLRALLRAAVAAIAPALTACLVGWVWIWWNAGGQMLHDKAARSLVWRLERAPSDSPRAARWTGIVLAAVVLVVSAVLLVLVPLALVLMDDFGVSVMSVPAAVPLCAACRAALSNWGPVALVTLGLIDLAALVAVGRCQLLVSSQRALRLALALLVLVVVYPTLALGLPLIGLVSQMSSP